MTKLASELQIGDETTLGTVRRILDSGSGPVTVLMEGGRYGEMARDEEVTIKEPPITAAEITVGMTVRQVGTRRAVAVIHIIPGERGRLFLLGNKAGGFEDVWLNVGTTTEFEVIP